MDAKKITVIALVFFVIAIGGVFTYMTKENFFGFSSTVLCCFGFGLCASAINFD